MMCRLRGSRFRVLRLGPMVKAPNISPVELKPIGSYCVSMPEAGRLKCWKARRLGG